MKLSESRLRQFILETILLESANLNESAAAAARRMMSSEPAGTGEASGGRHRSGSPSSGYGRPAGFGARASRPKTEEQKRKAKAAKIQGSKNNFKNAATSYYSDHVKNAYESGTIYMEWKEWLYEYIEDERKIYTSTPQLIKKVGAEYEIDRDWVDDNDPAKFDNEFIEMLEAHYLWAHDRAIGLRDGSTYR